MTITVHRLNSSDLALMEGVLDVFADTFEDEESYRRARPGRAYMASLLADPGFIAVAALKDEGVVGALAAYVLRKFERERSEVYIYDLAVAAAHRRQGIATALIEALKPIARHAGASVIFVQADPEDDPAIALYTRLGVREDVHHFDIAVD